jgi:hypothetical protein
VKENGGQRCPPFLLLRQLSRGFGKAGRNGAVGYRYLGSARAARHRHFRIELIAERFDNG